MLKRMKIIFNKFEYQNSATIELNNEIRELAYNI